MAATLLPFTYLIHKAHCWEIQISRMMVSFIHLQAKNQIYTET